MKKLLSLMFIGVLVLGGCSSPKAVDKSVTCTMDTGSGKMSYKLGYDSKKIVNKMGVELAMSGDTAITDEETKQLDDQYKQMMKDVKGVDYSVDVAKDKKSLKIAINIDLKAYDSKKDELGLLTGVTGAEGVALDKSKIEDITKTFEKMGLKCGEIK